MKKIISMILLNVLALTMVMGLTSCGGPTKEQFAKIDGLFIQYDAVVAACETEFAKFPPSEDVDYIQKMAQIETQIEQVKALAVESKKAYLENKDSYTAEKMDELIETMNTQIEKGETFKKSLIDGAKNANAIVNAEN